MKYFLEHNDKKYSNIDLIEAFKKLGIKKGDILCVHTELFNFGTPLLPRNEFLQTILDCFFEVIGKEGTLIMPTFTYSFCKNEVYDKLNSPTSMGALNEYFRKQAGVKRTNDPIFSFAIKGAKKELFLKDTTSCFEIGSVYDIFQKLNGKIILFGSSQTGYTFSHYIEEQMRVPYRFYKTFEGIIHDENGRIYHKKINYYVRKLEQKYEVSEKQINILKNNNIFDLCTFANADIVSINAQQYMYQTMLAIKKDPYAIIRGR
ncbi:aminoglycoside N(3)-acetyltransferase [Campylobacter lari]|nr:aminoglycoside N(3)-acetyltransferase [Campylobacter lari]EHU1054970.1 aminoglycoside N(3)-acetyltransferase [Campylobacter lari]EJV0520159.1 aminoglycoside N(3)-acetyltransferase [Campylobacter lari]HEC1762116.1 aminoglycoside N(3)-acetyltransferase [Campylobacter lari]